MKYSNGIIIYNKNTKKYNFTWISKYLNDIETYIFLYQ